jgi:hypothetical protein
VSIARARDPREFRGLCVAISVAVGAALNVPAFCLFRPSRGIGSVAYARQVAMYVAHVELRVSMQRVGEAFGRNRTTVAHACRHIEELRDAPDLDQLIAEAAATVESQIAEYGAISPDQHGRTGCPETRS